MGRELQSLCLLTQCLWRKFYRFKFATIQLEIHPQDGSERTTAPTRVYCGSVFRSERKVMASIAPVIILALAAGITAVWIGALGFGVVRLVEHAMTLL